MQAFFQQSIKQVISDYPEVGAILDEYSIGCVPCGAGDCKLEDVVEIHNLGAEDKHALLSRIARAIDPACTLEAPLENPSEQKAPQQIKYSPPVNKLVEEHKLILKLIALIPEIISHLDLESDAGRQRIIDCVDFIRNYADGYHHAKEEDILFGFFNPELEIIKVMYSDHQSGRAHVRGILQGVESANADLVSEHLAGYQALLSEHIRKEDEVLFPWMDRNLSTSEVGQLFQKFNAVEENHGSTQEKYSGVITRLENELKSDA